MTKELFTKNVPKARKNKTVVHLYEILSPEVQGFNFNPKIDDVKCAISPKMPRYLPCCQDLRKEQK